MNRKTVSILIIAAAIVLAITGYFVLPENCVTQIGSNPSHMNKIPAILVPFAVSVIFSVFYMKNEENSAKNLIGALLGIAIFFLLIFMNR